MAKHVLSLDIGNKYIHIAEGEQSRGGVEISKAFQILTPQGCFLNGKLENTEVLSAAIKTSLEKNKFRTVDTVLSVQGDSGLTRKMTFPKVKDLVYSQMVKFEMSQYLPSEIDNYIIQYLVNEEVVIDGVNSVIIWGAALNTSVVDKYYEMLEISGLKPMALDLHASAVLKLFRGNGNKTAAYVDFGHKNTGINIVSNKRLELNMNVGIGGYDIDNSISSQCGLGFEKAAEIKATLVNLSDNNKNEDSKEANAVVKTTINYWAAELLKVLQFYDLKRKADNIETIYLYGGSSQIQGLEDYLHQILNLPIVKLNSTEKIKYTGRDKSFQAFNYINCAGAILGC